MRTIDLSRLRAADRRAERRCAAIGHVVNSVAGTLEVAGLSDAAALGDRVRDRCARHGHRIGGEVLRLALDGVTVLPDDSAEGLAMGDARRRLLGRSRDRARRQLDRADRRSVRPAAGRPPAVSRAPDRGRCAPPRRRPPPGGVLGERLETGIAVFNTLLPLVRGQRIGLFAGSGVGKSSLLANLARGVEADVVVIALVGERGRELRDFVEKVLGPEGMARSVIVAATSDRSPLVRRRCAWTAMTVAEHFRDQGLQVLFLADSVTRFAEAHREVALAAGEDASLRGYPPSTVAHDHGALRTRRAGAGRARATSPRSSRCWSPAPTWKSRWPISCAGCSTAMW